MRILLLGSRGNLPRVSGADQWGPTIQALREAGHLVAWTDLPDGTDPMLVPVGESTVGEWLRTCDIALAVDGVDSMIGGMLRMAKHLRPALRIAAWSGAREGWETAPTLPELGGWLRRAAGVILGTTRRTAPLDLCQHPGLQSPAPSALFAPVARRGRESGWCVRHPEDPALTLSGERIYGASDVLGQVAMLATACARGHVGAVREIGVELPEPEREVTLAILNALRIMPASLAAEPVLRRMARDGGMDGRREPNTFPTYRALAAYLLDYRATGRVDEVLRTAVLRRLDDPVRSDHDLLAMATSLGMRGVIELDLEAPDSAALLATSEGWVSGFVREGSVAGFCRRAVAAMRGRPGFWSLNVTAESLRAAVAGHFLTDPAEHDGLRALLVDRAIPARARAAIAMGIAEGWPLIPMDLLYRVIDLTKETWFMKTMGVTMPMRTETPAAASAICDHLQQVRLVTAHDAHWRPVVPWR